MRNPSKLLAAIIPAVMAAPGVAGALEVTFRVDMSTQAGYGVFNPETHGVAVRGTFNGWAGSDLLSDPDADLVYEAVLDLASGSHAFKFVILRPPAGDLWEHSIDDRVIEVGEGPVELPIVFFDDDDTIPIAPRDVEVRFSVDLSIAASIGAFDPDADEIAVRGGAEELGDWQPPGIALARESETSRYAVWVPFDDMTNLPVPYKFVVHRGGDPSDVLWEEFIENRLFRVAGGEPDDEPPGGNGYAELVPGTPFFDHSAEWSPSERVIGADISGLPHLQSLGAEFTVGGAPIDPVETYRDHGFGVVRLRLWHTPDEPWHGTTATLEFAQDLVDAGYEIMLDLHYSDTWADPGRQTKPAAWEGLTFGSLVDSVYSYTNSVVRAFRDGGALPAYVQIGNEINPGFLWEDGRVGWEGSAWDTPAQWSQFATLLSAGIAAVRDSLPPGERPKIVIHAATGGDNAASRWFYDNLVARGVEFDVIGLSYYPWWHGTLDDLEANLRDLAATYGKEIQIVETAYPWTLEGNDGTGNFVDGPEDLLPGYDATPSGQLAFLRDLLATVEAVPGGLGTAVLYWSPDGVTVAGGPGNPYENLTLFDFDLDALPGLGFVVPWGTGVEEGGGETHGSLPLLEPGTPNPFASDTSLAYTVPDGGARVAVRVYDAAGRHVRTLVEASRPPGVYELLWDGRTSVGARAASGVYFVRATVGASEAVRKVVILR